MASKLEYRIVDQDPAAKVIKRSDVWVETRDASRGPLDAARTIQMYGTDESVDRHNTKLRVDGWDFSDYRKNPTFLWAHNNDLAVPMMPIGSVVRIQREEFERAEVAGKTDKRLLFDIEFPQRGTYPFADLVCDMYKQGHLRASSVGFKNLEMRRLSADKDKDEMSAEGYDLKAGFAADLTKNALLELSAVPVGSNPNALQKALYAAVPDAVRGIMEYLPDSGIDLDEEWVTKRLNALALALNPATGETSDTEDSSESDDLDKEIEKAVAELETKNAPAKKEPKSVPVFPDPLSGKELETLKEFKTELSALRSEIQALREEIKQMRAVSVGGNTLPKIDEPALSHLDMIIMENAESFERLAKIIS